MSAASRLPIEIDTPRLETLFPWGMFDGAASPGASRALEALRVLERLLNDASRERALYARHALLQNFSRPYQISESDDREFPSVSEDFLQRFARALCPDWYEDLLSRLSDEELEVFMKCYVYGHELWGHPEGVAALAQRMLQYCAQTSIEVNIQELTGQERPIPEELQSRLGEHDRYAGLGNDFVLGRRFIARPEQYEITVGPISMNTLGKLQRGGWAEGIRAASKLERVVQVTEPFYFHARIVIILETVGFILGQATVGKNYLGNVHSGNEEMLGALLGQG